MDTISFTCPSCSQTIVVNANYAGFLTGSSGLVLSLIIILPVQTLTFGTGSNVIAEVDSSPPVVNPANAVWPKSIPGLIGYWSFDKTGSARVAKDLSGNGNDGTLRRARRVNGVKGNALSFDDSSAYFDYGKSPRFNFPAHRSFTFAGWVKTPSLSGAVVSQRYSQQDGADMDLTVEHGRLVITIRQDHGVLPAKVYSNVVINDNRWHHFAFMRHQGNPIELFVDGISQGKDTGIHASGPITTDLRALGSERYWVQLNQGGHAGATPYLQGCVAEFCIFNRALTMDEVEDLAGLE